jgi:UDP-2-acetamido-2-deoxy-ribo-hexuluronate aminotransferase
MMPKIQMVDLQAQYQTLKPEMDAAIQQVLNSTQFIKGPEVDKFQSNLAQYLNIKHVIGCANGTDALQLALMALDLQPGDEVITTNFTFIATVEVIALLGLKPVLVDVCPDTYNINTDKIEQAITSKTKAIMPVHLFGQCANMEAILNIAGRYNLFVIEDAAQAMGAEYTFTNGKIFKAGTMGHIGCTSFFPSKNLGCYGDGGAVFTNDAYLAKRIASLANHGMEVRYHHDYIGINSRLDAIQAAVLNVKLPHLGHFNACRKQAANFYSDALKNINWITVPQLSETSSHVFHQYTLKIKGVDRNALKAHLETKEIPTMVYYPIPLHRQKAFLPFNPEVRNYPVSDALCKTVLSLPMHPDLTEQQLLYICDQIKWFKA